MPSISLIIPTLNESACLPDLLASLPQQARLQGIVVDGGSQDETKSLATAAGLQVLNSRRQRAAQLNAGAEQAQGDILLFLHADSGLAPDALDSIHAALTDPRVVGGAFRLRIADRSPSLRLLSFAVNLRSRFLGLPYGDQGLFVRRSVFMAMGGFRDIHIMEDLDFVLRLKRHGKMVCLPLPLQTSARRWQRNGVLRTTLVNLWATALYAAGRPTADIRRIYDRLLA